MLYNKYYEGKYWSSASYDQYTNGQSELTLGWVFLGVGAIGMIGWERK